MMKYEEPNERLKDQSRCAGARADLKMCLLESDCCKITLCCSAKLETNMDHLHTYVKKLQFWAEFLQHLHHRTPRECLKMTDGSVSDECLALRTVFFECKRSIIDGRRRFRGPKGY